MISTINTRVGRKKTNFEQTPGRFPEGTLARIDEVLEDGENRSDLLREAVEREIKRRLRAQRNQEADDT